MTTVMIEYAPKDILPKLQDNSNGHKIAKRERYNWNAGPTFTTDKVGIEAATEAFNRYHDKRSMVMGDIAIVDNIAYYYSLIGWVEL